jgi:hypothetical protein
MPSYSTSVQAIRDGGTETVASSCRGCWDAQGLPAENKLLRLRIFSLSPPPLLPRPNIRNLQSDLTTLYQSQQIFA